MLDIYEHIKYSGCENKHTEYMYKVGAYGHIFFFAKIDALLLCAKCWWRCEPLEWLSEDVVI